MGAPNDRGYRRSLKNLVLDPEYQLTFTLVMVGFCAVVMTVLGAWVMDAAEKATTVSIDNVLGYGCPEPELASSAPSGAVGATPVAPGPGGAAPGPSADARAAAHQPPASQRPPVVDHDPARERARPEVEIEIADEAGEIAPPQVEVEVEVDAELVAPEIRVVEPEAGGEGAPNALEDVWAEPSAASGAAVLAYHLCRLQQAATIDRLRAGKRRIFWVLAGVGIGLCLGLFLYGIKMTHRVAGPLHKVSQHLVALREGSYGPVRPLRKGDQLHDFHEQFRLAHEGLRAVEREDVEVLRRLIAGAERVGASSSPQLAATVAELRAILARKEAAGVE
jgi:hypothetical protein